MMGERKFTEHPIRQGAAYPRLIKELTYWANASDVADQNRVMQYVYVLYAYLEEQDVSKDALEPLKTLLDAFFDSRHGLHNELFKPNKDGKGHLPRAYARQMGNAALAVSITPRNMRKNILKQAAKKLKVSEKKLETFRRNLLASDGRIKPGTATWPFGWYIASNLSEEELESDHPGLFAAPLFNKLKPDMAAAEDIVKQLKPVPEKYRD